MRARNRLRLLLIPLVAWAFGGCDSPEFGRARGGGHGGDGGNYVEGQIHPPSKTDATKELSRIEHYGPKP